MLTGSTVVGLGDQPNSAKWAAPLAALCDKLIRWAAGANPVHGGGGGDATGAGGSGSTAQQQQQQQQQQQKQQQQQQQLRSSSSPRRPTTRGVSRKPEDEVRWRVIPSI
jgi:hypothetical protein